MDSSVAEQTKAMEMRSQELDQRAEELARKESELAAQRMGITDTDLLPPDAIAGECYARVWG